MHDLPACDVILSCFFCKSYSLQKVITIVHIWSGSQLAKVPNIMNLSRHTVAADFHGANFMGAFDNLDGSVSEGTGRGSKCEEVPSPDQAGPSSLPQSSAKEYK